VTRRSRPYFEPILLPHIKDLVDILSRKVRTTHDQFLGRIMNVVAPQFVVSDIGKEFELNVEDEKGPMVVCSSDPIRHKYPVIRPLADTK
jgi:hypothetical protein